MSTEVDLDEALRLADAATPGEWSAADEHGDLGPDASPAWCVSRMDGEKYLYDIAYTTVHNEQADAEFIAAARSLVPALILECRQLRSDVAELTERGEELERRNRAIRGMTFGVGLPVRAAVGTTPEPRRSMQEQLAAMPTAAEAMARITRAGEDA